MNNLLRVFIAPGEVFASMKEKIETVPPLLALLLCVAVFTGAQPLFVSDQSIRDAAEEQVEGLLGFFEGFLTRVGGEEVVDEFKEEWNSVNDDLGVSAEELLDEALNEAMTPEQMLLSRFISAISAPFSALMWLGLGAIILSTYFNVSGNTRERRRQWNEWFGFTLWTLMPVVLDYLLYFVVTLVTGDIKPKPYLAPLAWLPGLHDNAFAVNLTFGMIWAIYIQTIGMHRWMDRPIPICLIIVLIPWLVQWLIASGVVEAVKAV